MSFTDTRLVTAKLPASAQGGGIYGLGTYLEFIPSAPIYNVTTGEDLSTPQYGPVNPVTTEMGYWDAGLSANGVRLVCNDSSTVIPGGTYWRVRVYINGQFQGPEQAITVSVTDPDPLKLVLAVHVSPSPGGMLGGINDLTSVDASVVITTPRAGIRDLSVVGGGGGGAPPSNSTPTPDTVPGSAGTGTAYSRGDHAHPRSAVYIPATDKGAANGVATLDALSKIPNAQLPNLAITDTFVAASQAAMLALAAQRGDVAVRTDLSESFILAADDPTVLANWVLLQTPAAPVQSVNGHTGVVNLVAADVGAAATANNLSDLASASTARTNLGLGNILTLLGAVARTIISKAGSVIGTRRQINFVDSASVTWTLTDDSTNEKVDVSAAAAGGGGGSDPRITGTGSLDLGTFAATIPAAGTIGILEAVQSFTATKRMANVPLEFADGFGNVSQLRYATPLGAGDGIEIHNNSSLLGIHTSNGGYMIPWNGSTGKQILLAFRQGSGVTSLNNVYIGGLTSDYATSTPTATEVLIHMFAPVDFRYDGTYVANKGPVLTDRSDGHTYRLKVTGGVLGVELVT